MKAILHHVIRMSLAVFILAFIVARAHAQAPPLSREEIDNYQNGPDSKPQKDVPKGKQFSFEFDESKIFPGTRRKITVYIPAQYKADKPACVYVGLDQLKFEVPTVFDNLIHKGEMPVTIAVGVSPGSVPSAEGKVDPRFNRSFEFDGMNDSLARMIVEEIFPEVEKRQTPDGLPIKLSQDPNDRCTGGGSTGGIAAFTLAWERPDQFRRVFTAIGTFVGMRGGDRYPVLVRKTEPKPIRVFQQDGENDQWRGGPEVGDWWMSNQTLDRALEFAGYEHEHIWGTGPHSAKHATAIFPDAMRYLWKDWPQAVVAQTARTQNVFLNAILEHGEDWIHADYPCPPDKTHLTSDTQGTALFREFSGRGSFRFPDFERTAFVDELNGPDMDGPMAFGPDGRCYVADRANRRIVAYDAGTLQHLERGKDKFTVIATEIRGNQLIVTHDSRIYVTETLDDEFVGPKGDELELFGPRGAVHLIRPDEKKVLVSRGIRDPGAIAISPDGLWLSVAERHSHIGYSFRIKSDGTLDARAPLYSLQGSGMTDGRVVGNWCFDRDGRLYATTRLGIQVLDRNGRARCILPLPEALQATSVCFGGPNFDTLYAIGANARLYKRKMKVSGAPSWLAPIKLPPWGAG